MNNRIQQGILPRGLTLRDRLWALRFPGNLLMTLGLRGHSGYFYGG